MRTVIELGTKPQTGSKNKPNASKILASSKLRIIVEVLVTIVGLIGSVGGVIIYGDTYNNTTTFLENPTLPDHPTSNVLPTSGSSSEPDENKTPVTSPTKLPGVVLKENTTNNYITHSEASTHNLFTEPPKSETSSESGNNITASLVELIDIFPNDKNNNGNHNAEDLEPPTINSFEADSDQIVYGENTNLIWDVSDTKNATIELNGEDISTSSSKEVNPTETTTYTLIARNDAGSDEKKVTVEVKKIEPPQIDSFYADSENIVSGQNTTLIWSVSGATDVTIDPDIENVSPIDSVEVSPTEDTTYTLTAKNGDEGDKSTVTKTVTIYVNKPEPPAIDSFYADSENIVSGRNTTLIWNVSDDPDTVTIEPDIGTVESSGSTTVNPTEDTTYTLTATNKGGSTDKEVIVSVEKVELSTGW